MYIPPTPLSFSSLTAHLDLYQSLDPKFSMRGKIMAAINITMLQSSIPYDYGKKDH